MTYNVFSGTLNLTQSIRHWHCISDLTYVWMCNGTWKCSAYEMRPMSIGSYQEEMHQLMVYNGCTIGMYKAQILA